MKNDLIKQDMNFLEKPLWFCDIRSSDKNFVWTDIEGFEYRSAYKLPDKVDIVILLYLLKKCQENEYNPVVACSRYEILKACSISTNNANYERLEDSLKRWAGILITFKGTFYDHKKYISMGFHILNHYEIDEKTKQVVITLDEKWILKIRESNFFQLLNFEYYKALRRPISRRLHEVLSKSFFTADTFTIGLVKLGTKLTLFKRTSKGDRIHASDVLTKIKPAINEINRMAENKESYKLGKSIFRIDYQISGVDQDRTITFKKIPVNLLSEGELCQTEKDINDLLSMIKSRNESLDQIVTRFYHDKGFDYVKWNILYSNKKASKNYSTFLQKSLNENWAGEWKIEESRKEDLEKKRQAEAERKRAEDEKREKEKKEALEQLPFFLEEIEKVESHTKIDLWEKAEKLAGIKEVGAGEEKSDFQKKTEEKLIKLKYFQLLFEHLNCNGHSFSSGVICDHRPALKMKNPKEKA